MLNQLNPLEKQTKAIELCQQSKDPDACNSLLNGKVGYDIGGNQFPNTTVGDRGQVKNATQALAEGGEALLAPGMDMDVDPFLPLLDILGEEAYSELQMAMEDYPAVMTLAEMAMHTSDGSVEGMGGPTEDGVPARLSPGEFVFSAEAVDVIGPDTLNNMHEEAKQQAAAMI